jgi:hypothetical protein
MAITTAQLNAGKAAVLEQLFVQYPPCRIPAIRATIKLAKGGNQTQQEIARALLQQAYQAATGRDPFEFAHNFKQWLREALEDVTGADPVTGIDRSDAFDPQVITIT